MTRRHIPSFRLFCARSLLLHGAGLHACVISVRLSRDGYTDQGVTHASHTLPQSRHAEVLRELRLKQRRQLLRRLRTASAWSQAQTRCGFQEVRREHIWRQWQRRRGELGLYDTPTYNNDHQRVVVLPHFLSSTTRPNDGRMILTIPRLYLKAPPGRLGFCRCWSAARPTGASQTRASTLKWGAARGRRSASISGKCRTWLCAYQPHSACLYSAIQYCESCNSSLALHVARFISSSQHTTAKDTWSCRSWAQPSCLILRDIRCYQLNALTATMLPARRGLRPSSQWPRRSDDLIGMNN